MSRVNVDVAVVGGELCGLAAAALLSLGGKKVVVIDDGDVVARPLGDRLAPIASSLWKLPAGGPAAGLFDALALKADARRLLGESVGLGVVDDPDLRMVLPASEEALIRELTRCFGDERGRAQQKAVAAVDAARRFPVFGELAAINEDGFFFEARRARGRVTALGSTGDVAADDDAVVRLQGDGAGLWPVASQLRSFVQSLSPPAERGLAAALSSSFLSGGVPLGGGLGARTLLRDLLLSFVKHHGGDVVHERVDVVEVTGKRLTLLRTAARKEDSLVPGPAGGQRNARDSTRPRPAGSDEFVPRVVIDATASRDLSDRLPSSRLREKLLAGQGRVVVVGKSTSVRWLVPVRLLPRGMPPLLLLLGQGGDPPALISLCAGAPLDGGGKGSHLDEQLLALVATSPTDDAAWLEDQLTRLLPFTREHLRARDVVDASPVHAAFVVKDSEHALAGRRPRTPFANLVRAGRDLCPAFGIDGELVAARAVVSIVEGSLPKNALVTT
ncbi:MAG: hypothetical protein Q8O67_06480 [Deltaproteobacteria bacterium]|nr:hypothetical protein [Deltaproteobacteria bacterium]